MKNLLEAVYRSPKWLQKFADFEFRTGDDIKGEPSEKQKEKIRKEEERLKKEKEEKERKDRFEREEWERRARIEFEKLKRERLQREAEQNKKREQERIEKELQDIFNRLVIDFQNAPYSDKIETPVIGGEVTFKYRFENGWTFEIVGNKITYTDDKYQHGYKIGLIWRSKFVQLANEMGSKQRRRYGSGSEQKRSGSTDKETKKTENPQKDKYNLIKDKIKLREEQLSKMSKTDTNRQGLENELQAYKRVRDKMNAEYKFEGLKYLKKFEAKRWTLDELFDAMKHPFLDRKFVTEIFSDVENLGYSLGFKGQYNHDWIFPDGYNTVVDVEDINQRYKLKGFELAFYKDLDVDSGDYRPISEIKDELTAFENSITQYLNQPEFDDEYEFSGIHIEIDGDPKAHNLQRISLKFINKSAKQTPYSNIYDQD